jgi:heptosyltransferase-1
LGYSVPPALEYGLRAPRVDDKSNSVVFLTMTSREDKLWPEQSWIELGRALGMSAVLPWGSEAERLRVNRIAQALPGARVPPRMPVAELATLFASARAVVGVDTGLTHLAAALGSRTVGVYCGSDPGLTGVYGAPCAVNLGAKGRGPSWADVLKALS